MTTKGEILELTYEWASDIFGERGFEPNTDSVPVSGATIYPSDIVSLVSVVLQGWYTEGKNCKIFKNQLMKTSMKTHVSLCNSGSSANLLAVSGALEELGRKKFIVTCATGFPTTVAPIYQNKQIPIYVDIDPYTLMPDTNQLMLAYDKFGDDISGAIFAHTLGLPFDEAMVREITRPGWLISDCCDALGAELNYPDEPEFVPVGSYSDIATYSFFPAHQITTAEGGAVVTNYGRLHRVIESIGNWGRGCWCKPGENDTCGHRFDCETGKLPAGWDHKYSFDRLGYNLKMTEFQAGLGISQISRLDQFTKRRRDNFLYLYNGLKKYDCISTIELKFFSIPSPFGFPIRVHQDADFTAQELIAYLEEHKIGTRRVFGGNLTKQPGFMNLPYQLIGHLDGSDIVMNDVFWIGCWHGLREDHLDYVLEVFSDFFKMRG